MKQNTIFPAPEFTKEELFQANVIKMSEALAKLPIEIRNLVIETVQAMDQPQYETLTWAEISQLNIAKSKFAAHIGITDTFDTALPQAWLTNFVITTGLSYHKVLYSTFAVYPKDSGMIIISGWDKVANILNSEN